MKGKFRKFLEGAIFDYYQDLIWGKYVEGLEKDPDYFIKMLPLEIQNATKKLRSQIQTNDVSEADKKEWIDLANKVKSLPESGKYLAILIAIMLKESKFSTKDFLAQQLDNMNEKEFASTLRFKLK